MNLDRVTMTGADDSIDPAQLVDLSGEFPFVEWGVLLSASSGGAARFPSKLWLAKLYITCQQHPMQIAFHVCGRWVREICAGNWTPLFTNVGPVLGCGQRVQLNFHSYRHLLSPGFLAAAVKRCEQQGWQVIFQCDGENDSLVSNAYDDGLDAVPFYDRSGGAGIVPDEWPRPMAGIYNGYAGGLGPDNLASELASIASVAGDERVWVDMETKVRTPDNQKFDLAAVKVCLDIAVPWI